MRATFDGTPVEQERARRGWRRSTAYSGTSATQDIDAGGARSCQSCVYLRWPASGARKPAPRCAVPEAVLAAADCQPRINGDITTQVTAICRLYRRSEVPA
jgi:hypothetical protein